MRDKIKIIIITGPTASGKSDLAVQIAKERSGEIISADSRQVYIGLDIGSGKVTTKEMQNIEHYCLDIVNPKLNIDNNYKFTVVDWLKYAEEAIEKIISKNKIPIICGGTGMYIEGLVYGIQDNPLPDFNLREKLEGKSLEDIQNLLIKKDKESNKNIFESLNNSERNNKARLIRKLEINNNYIFNKNRESKYDIEWIVLKPDLNILKDKIKIRLENRLDEKSKQNMIDEVKSLINSGVSKEWLKSLGLEYKYITMYLEGEIDYENMKNILNTKIYQYAKRQITWNKKFAR